MTCDKRRNVHGSYLCSCASSSRRVSTETGQNFTTSVWGTKTRLKCTLPRSQRARTRASVNWSNRWLRCRETSPFQHLKRLFTDAKFFTVLPSSSGVTNMNLIPGSKICSTFLKARLNFWGKMYRHCLSARNNWLKNRFWCTQIN